MTKFPREGRYQILNPQLDGAAMGLTGADTGGRGVAVGLVGPDRNDYGQLWLVEVDDDSTVQLTNEQTNTMLLLGGTGHKGDPVVCGGGEIHGAMPWSFDGDAEEEAAVLVPGFNHALALAPAGPHYGLTVVDNTRDGTQLWRFVPW
ncbi:MULTISPECIES: hypothetical protein [Nocardia]|uniref:Ricin B lectin domain-containing protein n=1 Tax=Nocardia sputorum TaxID=2984338 RepID=A0ABN6U2H7_9NOCA|nr:hypothetical protein [Nocardia sputorum]BDT90833.1 hypothetical protein IFM12275_08090 [Nocardia sputorum]BDT99461.1 hypothetical protein IFM12276_24900 [Nocardia sputorum]